MDVLLSGKVDGGGRTSLLHTIISHCSIFTISIFSSLFFFGEIWLILYDTVSKHNSSIVDTCLTVVMKACLWISILFYMSGIIRVVRGFYR